MSGTLLFRRCRSLGTALLVTFAACHDRPGLTAPDHLKPSASISDGAHGAGNGDVFFLPPLVPDPSGSPGYGDPFQPGLPVAFRICVVVNGTCDTTIRDFAPSQVTMSLTDQDYQANWDTKADNLDPAKTYRIEVHIGGKTVAFADVDVVSSGSQLRNVNTGAYIALLNGRTLPIKVRVEQGWNCASHESCVTKVVTNTPPSGQTYTVVTSSDGENVAAFPANWFDPTVVPNGQVLVTIEDVTDQMNAPGAPGCSLGLSVMLTGGRCVRFTTDPKVTFTNTVVVQVCEVADANDHRQMLLKYDYDEVPEFLRNVPPPSACPEHHLGAASRSGVMGRLAYALSRLGGAVKRLVGPKNAYAFDLGVGGAIDAGGGFSMIASGLPVTMSVVAGDGQTAPAGTLLPDPITVALTTVHPTPAPLANDTVTCTVTGGGGTVNRAASAIAITNSDGIAICPPWLLGTTPGANSLRVTARNVDPLVVVDHVAQKGYADFSATGTGSTPYIATLTLASSTVTWDMGGNSFDATIVNPTGTAMGSASQPVILQGWIVQGTTRRGAGGADVLCGAGIGILPTGTCTMGFSVSVGPSSGGTGTLVNGTAMYELDLAVGNVYTGIISTKSVPILITGIP